MQPCLVPAMESLLNQQDIPNISTTLPLLNCSESTHYQLHIHYFYSVIDHNSLPIMKIRGKEIRKFQILYKRQDESMISWLYIGYSILMIGTHFYLKNRNTILPCGSKHTFIVVESSLLLIQNKQFIYMYILHNIIQNLRT